MTDYRSGRGQGSRGDFPSPVLSDSAAEARRQLYTNRAHQPLRAQWDPMESGGVRFRGDRPVRQAKKQSTLGRFASTYGWRAYAIPVLVVITVLIVVDAVRSTGKSLGMVPGSPRPAAPIDANNVVGAPPRGDGKFAPNISSGALPGGGPIAVSGAGAWHIVPGTTGQIGEGKRHVFTYTVEVEDGIDGATIGGDDAFGRMVETTLADPRSWTKDPQFGFKRVDSGDPDFRVSLTSQMTTRTACGYDIQLDTSCFNKGIGRVVLNEARWVRGAVAFQGDMTSYRQYMINHEVGHAIGFDQHQPCEVPGGLAPIMMQQTFGTADNEIASLDPAGVVPMDGKVCRPNSWPYPTA